MKSPSRPQSQSYAKRRFPMKNTNVQVKPSPASANYKSTNVTPTSGTCAPAGNHLRKQVKIADIVIPDTHADCDFDAVELVAESFKFVGQLQPILLLASAEGNSLTLLAGRVRYEAAITLGWSEIDAITGDDPRQLRLMAIAEDLHRRELSILQRAALAIEWLDLTRAREGHVAHPLGGKQPQDRGLKKTAIAAGMDRRSLARLERIGSLAPDVIARATEAGLSNKQNILLQIAALPTVDDQLAEVDAVLRRRLAARRRQQPVSSEPAIENALKSPRSDCDGAVHQPVAPAPLVPAADPLDIPLNLVRSPAVIQERLRQEYLGCAFRRLLHQAPADSRLVFLRETLIPDAGVEALLPTVQLPGES